LARASGAQKLGYNITAVPPGKQAFPLHNHRANDGTLLALQRTGEIRISENPYPIHPGDVIAFPPGGKETDHQTVNSGSEQFRYHAVSTILSPELVVYPYSAEFGVLAEIPRGPDGKPQRFVSVGRESDSQDYREGE